jgi:hypothetical protein
MEANKSLPASPAADNLPNVPIKPDPAVSAEANGHVAGETKAPPPECQVKAQIKCQSCGKDVQWPEEVIKQLQALGQSVQTVLASVGVDGTTPSAPAPAGDQPAKPSMPPSENQGMAPENHDASPDASPKPEGLPAEKPATEPEKPGETEPDEDDKKPEDKAMKCSKCGLSMDKCKCNKSGVAEPPVNPKPGILDHVNKSDSAKAFDIMENPTVKALVKELETVKERVHTLEALPISNGPAKSAVKMADNPRMDNNSALLDDVAREKFYDELANDTTVNFPTRQAAAMKAQELSLKRTIAKGPQPLKQ